MKQLTPLLMSMVLIFGAAACQNPSKTAESAPDTNETPQASSVQETEAAKQDAESDVRRRQLNSDIRAREERNNVTGGDTKRKSGDLASEVRSKLEANIPESQLSVDATEDGTVNISGTVKDQAQLAKVEPLSKEIKGVKVVVIKVNVAPIKK